MHQKWEAVIERYREEEMKAWDADAKAMLGPKGMPRKKPDPQASPIFASGELKETAKDKYPVYHLLSPILEGPFHSDPEHMAEGIKKDNQQRLREEDGVSDYSKSYWEEFETNMKMPFNLQWRSPVTARENAMHETLAEIARIEDDLQWPKGQHAQGMIQQTWPLKKIEPVWTDLYDAVNDAYASMTGKQGWEMTRKRMWPRMQQWKYEHAHQD
jgi:hypothetical protein